MSASPAPSERPSGTAAGVRIADLNAVRTITLDRPEALNSLNAAMHAALMGALESAAADPSVRCVVLTGAGRGFCAGQDLADPAVAPPADPQAPMPAVDRLIDERYRPLALRLRRFPTPVVAAVNGVAAGAGASLALNCDLVVAARSARFIQAFSKIGLIPDCGATWLLPRLVGRGRALGLAMLAERLDAADALAAGLIWQVVDDAGLAAAAQALGERLAALPTEALVETRRVMDEGDALGYEQSLALEAQVQGRLGHSADAREGMRAFIERRTPTWAPRKA